ncbi:uncharacterized protein B0I36DRAFT_313000 [Microdochium trichocladiopsis]|uniref:Uncharacterized protein n=1 Tax=Microdochium trichocladiopsis TaxID=1682393 RepID=A0A9P9BV11_9PEZI|nr:uncharacterized protein B0I36DRAFT_313000 [Microdochium trichocladiopsis]KAH7041546.1 hypothetical protein B0I36DRAFT_313000 [Microdochium trichocladiopsis]
MVHDPDRPHTNNVFVRFRHSVDDTIRRGIDTVSHRAQQPSSPEQSSSAHPRQGPTTPSSSPSPKTDALVIYPSPGRVRLVDLDPPVQESSTAAAPTTSMSSTQPESAVAVPANDFDNFADPELWARHSPYSPFNLQHLPQPVPRDVSQTQGYNDFTFRDAFEDLMLVSSGRPLPRGPELLANKLHVDFMFAHGMPVSNWVRMLSVRGLWAPYFPQHPKLHSWEHLGLGDEIASMLMDWGLDGRWLTGFTKHQGRSPDERFSTSKKETDSGEQQGSPQQHPDTEEDLYGDARENTGDTQPRHVSPWDLMFEALNEARTHQPRSQSTESSTDLTRTDNALNGDAPKETEETDSRKTWDGGRVDTVRKRREHNGQVETTETRLRYDADGNLVGRSESTKIKTSTSASGSESDEEFSGSSTSSSSSQWSRTWKWGQDGPRRWKRDKHDVQHDEHTGFEADDGDGKSGHRKPSGWFWTK